MVATRKRLYETSSTLIRRATRSQSGQRGSDSQTETSGKAITNDDERVGPVSLQLPRTGRSSKRCRLLRRAVPEHDLTGYLGLLPIEILEKIMHLCNPSQLGQLDASCKYFRAGNLIETMAKQRLQNIPRAKDLIPDRRLSERWLKLLLFVTYQSTAAAQGTAIAFGSYHSAALLLPSADEHVTNRITHSVYTFGRGFHGQLGSGSYDQLTAPSTVSLGYKASLEKPDFEEEVMPAVVACGSSHTASISRRGELFTWGLASSGELGHNGWMPIEVNIPKQSFPVCNVRIVSVATGGNHTLGISEYGGLFTCGRGRHGQLGHGAFHDEGNLIPVASLKCVLPVAAHDLHLPLTFLNHSRSYRIVSAAAGKAHSMALAADGTLFTWGHGKSGQLGHSQLEELLPFMAQQAIVVPTPQKVDELEPSGLESGRRVTAISASGNHSMVLTVNGRILAFGCNAYGQLGLGDVVNRWRPVEVQLKSRADKKACVRAVQVVCGRSHSLALVSREGSLHACSTGHNAWGQLGLGDLKDKHVFTVIPGLSGVAALQSGDDHCGAVTNAGDLYCWGRGDCGQLGMGDTRSHWAPKKLHGFKVVHPDRTLRRHKRCTPNMRLIAPEPKKKDPPPTDGPIDRFFKRATV